eukprot:353034-Chlamydomonas_euryale.AAC.4
MELATCPSGIESFKIDAIPCVVHSGSPSAVNTDFARTAIRTRKQPIAQSTPTVKTHACLTMSAERLGSCRPWRRCTETREVA